MTRVELALPREQRLGASVFAFDRESWRALSDAPPAVRTVRPGCTPRVGGHCGVETFSVDDPMDSWPHLPRRPSAKAGESSPVNIYEKWNNSLAKHFFNEANVGRPVYLYVNDAVIATIGQSIGENPLHFVHAVAVGPPWVRRSGLCQRALKALEGWRTRKLEYPPYIGFLGLFVLAAGLDGDFAPHAYYPRLRTLLGAGNASGQLPSFHRMLELRDQRRGRPRSNQRRRTRLPAAGIHRLGETTTRSAPQCTGDVIRSGRQVRVERLGIRD